MRTRHTLYTKIRKRCGYLFVEDDSGVDECTVLVSDSAKSLIKLAAGNVELIKDNQLKSLLSSRCNQHRFFSAVAHMTCHNLNIMNDLFCATCLLNKGKTKRILHAHIAHGLKSIPLDFEPSSPDELAHNTALVAILDATDHDIAEYEMGDTQIMQAVSLRREARQRLLQNCPRRWTRDSGIAFYVRLGSPGRTRAEAGDIVFRDLVAALLHVLPRLPALNKWNKVFNPLGWWKFATDFGGLVPKAMIAARNEQDFPDTVIAMDAIGLGQADEYRQVNRGRWVRTIQFVSSPASRACVSTALAFADIANKYMMHNFASARLHAVKQGVLVYLHSSTSPSVAAVLSLFAMVNEPDHIRWSPLRAGCAWSPQLVALVANSAASLIGNIFIRVILPYLEPPWWIGSAAHDLATESDVAEVYEKLRFTRQCCLHYDDGFTLKFKARVPSLEAMRAPENMSFLTDVFKQCDETNIPVEFRFSRHRHHTIASAGKGPSPSTIASLHVLGEMRALHGSAHERYAPLDFKSIENTSLSTL